MTPEQIEQERIAFEAWYIKYGNYTEQDKFLYLGRNPNTNMYTIPHIQDMWRGWLARAEQTGWISVEEELPDYGITVLTATEEGFVSTGCLVEERGTEFDCIWRFAVTSSPITHWQPLPQPPKGD